MPWKTERTMILSNNAESVLDARIFGQVSYDKCICITYPRNCEVLTLLVKTDNYGKVKDTTTEKKNIDYREEEIPDCGCIYG